MKISAATIEQKGVAQLLQRGGAAQAHAASRHVQLRYQCVGGYYYYHV